jgi:hypothetical protein
MISIILTEDDFARLQAIVIDRDAKEALAFVQDRLAPEMTRQKAMKMKSSLEGGKGSVI